MLVLILCNNEVKHPRVITLIDDDNFRTIIYEVAAIINGRPITSVITDYDVPLALTPAH